MIGAFTVGLITAASACRRSSCALLIEVDR